MLLKEELKKENRMLTKEQLDAIKERAGVHSAMGQPVPEEPEKRLLYGLLEILDFECCKYGDAPEGVTEEDIKQYLLEHKDEISNDCVSSFVGLFCGVFSFLGEKVEQS